MTLTEWLPMVKFVCKVTMILLESSGNYSKAVCLLLYGESWKKPRCSLCSPRQKKNKLPRHLARERLDTLPTLLCVSWDDPPEVWTKCRQRAHNQNHITLEFFYSDPLHKKTKVKYWIYWVKYKYKWSVLYFNAVYQYINYINFVYVAQACII